MPQEESPIEPTPSVSLPTKNTIITLPRRPFVLSQGIRSGCMRATGLMIWSKDISEHGVLNPAIIRKIERDEDGFEYEMLAGHNRQNAAGACKP